MEVKVIPETGESQAWTISETLLSYHSDYFKRLCLLRNASDEELYRTELKCFEPRIFDMFIRFIYYGQCSYNDDREEPCSVLDSAKAWVLGDDLEALEFKNFHMRNLYGVYMPFGSTKPKAKIGPELVAYCYTKTTKDSKLSLFILSVLVQNWGDNFVVSCNNSNKEEWISIWEEHGLGNDLLLTMNGIYRDREHHNRYLSMYLEKALVPTDKSD